MAKIAKPTEAPPAQESPFNARDFRVPDERQALMKGVLGSVGIVGVLLGVAIPVSARVPMPLGAIILGLIILWVLVPFGLLGVRASLERTRWRTAQSTPLPFPPNRINPQEVVRTICRLLRMGNCPEVLLVPGRPAIRSLDGRILITDELYTQTTDRDLQVLLIHELAHHFAGHIPLLPYALMTPTGDAESWLRPVLLPGLPLYIALEDWLLNADITADRLILLIKPDINLAILGVLKELVFAAPESVARTNLVRFLGTAEGILDRGEQFMVGHQLSDLLHIHPEAESRVANLRAWLGAEGYSQAAKRLRDNVGAP